MAHSANKTSLFDIQGFSANQHFLIAYSGGADSTALLHYCAHNPQIKNRIRAIHINHQLQQQSDAWQSHCQKQCKDWKVPVVIERMNLNDDSENTARNARRDAFEQHLKSNEVLLTGHHLQDQIETVLFRLFRGTGLKGIGGMQENSKLPNGQLIHRPLLHLNKSKITSYLQSNHLSWLEDPSNHINQYSRNHIRNELLPVIKSYDEHAFEAISKSSQQLQASHELLMQLMPAQNPLPWHCVNNTTFLHHWIQKQNINPPPAKQLDAFINSCNHAEKNKKPSIHWHNHCLILWREQLYLLNPIPQPEDTTLPFKQNMALPCGGQIAFSQPLGINLLQIRYAVTGARIKQAGHTHHKSIKKLHQEQQTSPWDKYITPFIYHQESLVAVGSWVSEDFHQQLIKNNCDFSWQKPKQVL